MIFDQGLVANQNNAFQWQYKTAGNIHGFKECVDTLKIIFPSVVAPHRYNEIFNLVHHARLENIFEKLIIIDRSACFDFNDYSTVIAHGICIEIFILAVSASKENWDLNLFFLLFPRLHLKSER